MSQTFWLSKDRKVYISMSNMSASKSPICQKQNQAKRRTGWSPMPTSTGGNMRKLPPKKSWGDFFKRSSTSKLLAELCPSPPKKLEKSHHLVIHPTIPWIYHPLTVENEVFYKYLVDGWATRLKKYSSSNWESFPQTGWTEQEYLKPPPSGYLWLIIPKNQIWEHQINGHIHVIFLGTSPNLPTVPLWQIPMGKAPKNVGILWYFFHPQDFHPRTWTWSWCG